MNEQNQNNQQNSNSSLNQEKGSRQATQSSNGFKKLLAKKWFSPAVFMISAALIVTLLWVLQDTNTEQPTTSTEVTETDETEAVVDTITPYEPQEAATSDDMVWPVADISTMTVEIPYYDLNGTAEEKEAALIQVDTTFAPHMGIDLVSEDNTSFEVLAALDGVVSLVESNPINGNIIEINHGNGFVTVYQSLADVNVEQGDEVAQGDVIAMAGRSDVEKDLGAHLHFEARLNGQPVNPQAYIVD